VRPVGGGEFGDAFAARTAAGERVFAKRLPGAPIGLFEAEARGLDRLRVDGGPPIPTVLAVAADGLVLEWIEAASPSRPAAARFGRSLATMHRGSSRHFGADAAGFVATMPLDNSAAVDWPTFHAERRLAPALAEARQRDALSPADAEAVGQVIARLPSLAGPAEPPARIHGDLWSGNLIWDRAGEVWLVDGAAACDGHRETDLAMLMLFGAAHLQDVLAAYDKSYPLAAGWQERVALHQIHPLLIHAALFGGGYGQRAGAAAKATLRSRSAVEGGR
jgi:fructosamine-3-kinase